MDGTSYLSRPLTSLEVCAGAGGQALGLERAGFEHVALCELDKHARATLKLNRPGWNILEEEAANLKTFDARPFHGVDLLAGGLPCPPFSVAGKQLGADDERNLFPDFLRLVNECAPRAVLIENVRGFLDRPFEPFRKWLRREFGKQGYTVMWKLLNASDFGVSQLRPRVAIVALPKQNATLFQWPDSIPEPPLSVGDLLGDLMGKGGWEGAGQWAVQANDIAPTVVGGSHKHGGPDLGPTRARAAWAKLGVEGRTIANAPPEPGFTGMPRLTVEMVARVQGFPANWAFSGKKTPAYRQVGNAFPPPVAEALGREIARTLMAVQLAEA